MKKIVYTIGYGGVKDINIFLEALQQEKIKTLIDVRSIPSSKYYPSYNPTSLENQLCWAGIQYIWLGNDVGGFSTPTQEGIDKLSKVLKGIKGYPVLMCVEKDSDKCHRGYWLTPALMHKGFEVIHLIIGNE